MAAPSVSEIAARSKKKVASELSSASGMNIKPKDVTPKAFEAAQNDPTPPDEKVAEIEAKPKKNSNDKIYLALAAALPTVIGAAFGGAEGGALGAKVTGDVAGSYMKSLADKEKDAKEQEQKIELAKIAAGQRSAEAELNRQNRIDTAQIMAGDRAQMREEKQLEKQADIERKKKEGVIELEDRYSTIEQNLEALQEMVKETGGFDFTGPQNQQMEQFIESIAVDMAKLVDPSSVARESEVAQAKKLLFDPSFFTRESNVKAVLDNFKEIAKRKRETAYKVRGLEPPQQEAQASFEPDVIKYAETHGITPEAAQAIKDKRTSGK